MWNPNIKAISKLVQMIFNAWFGFWVCWLCPAWYNVDCSKLMSRFDRYQLQLVYPMEHRTARNLQHETSHVHMCFSRHVILLWPMYVLCVNRFSLLLRQLGPTTAVFWIPETSWLQKPAPTLTANRYLRWPSFFEVLQSLFDNPFSQKLSSCLEYL